MYRFHPDIILLARWYRALCYEQGSQQDLVHNPFITRGGSALRGACLLWMAILNNDEGC